ncbi:MAG: hypothetical protein KJ069_21555 [Anaerolineae bacterium]|nr:hypothetical protein [Anaerolineae bacterium]
MKSKVTAVGKQAGDRQAHVARWSTGHTKPGRPRSSKAGAAQTCPEPVEGWSLYM